MTTTILQFPLARRVAFVRRHAANIARAATDHHARAMLAELIRVQAETMRRRGIGDDVVQREIETLRAAIRSHVVRLMPSRGGVG
jgi:spore coat polysaccharide biosynthesis protein SpsF (cytidylyltransferase family)